MIYCGPLGQNSCKVIEYFEVSRLLCSNGASDYILLFSFFFFFGISFSINYQNVPGVSNIRENYNPATWMLKVTSPSAEAELGIDFAQVYKNSAQYE